MHAEAEDSRRAVAYSSPKVVAERGSEPLVIINRPEPESLLSERQILSRGCAMLTSFAATYRRSSSFEVFRGFTHELCT